MKPNARRAHLIANSKSGKGRGSTLAQEAQAICDELGYELIDYPILSPKDFERQSQIAVDNAMKDGGIVIAAGGDGTIRGVAQAAKGRAVRFGVIPCGTFNFFARTHRIPEDNLEAFRLALSGEARPVRLGEVNGHIFLINASLGLYAKAIREREIRTSRFGRNRIVVIISTMMSLLDRHRLLKVDLMTGKEVHTTHTPMIFIGNNALQLRDLAFSVAQCMKRDLLAVVMMKPVTKIETLRIILRGVFKTVESDERLETFCVDELTIHTRKSSHQIALDGEIIQVNSPLRVKSLPGILNLVLPPKEKIDEPTSHRTPL
jgi:diacylglycerol kinase family enzyme